MDYSALSFDDDDESPFARERSTGLPKPPASSTPSSSPFLRPHSHLGSPGGGGSADHDQHDTPFLGYSPDLGLGASSSPHPAAESEDGFGAASAKLNPEEDGGDDGDEDHPGHGRTAESNGSTNDREPSHQPHQTHQTPARYKPHLQQQQQQQQHHHHHHQQQQQQPRPGQFLQAKVTGLERNGRKDPILKFDVHTNLPKFNKTTFRDVRRTHAEFQKLGEHLVSSNPECMVPAVPPSATSAGVGTDEDERRVRGLVQRWLNVVCGNDVLMRDDEVRFFVEADFGYSPGVRLRQPATGVRRKVLKQFAPPPDDTPELERARPVVKAFYLGAMETGQKVDRAVRARRGLGLAESALGNALGVLGGGGGTGSSGPGGSGGGGGSGMLGGGGGGGHEAHAGLAHALRKLGRTVQSVGDFHAAQATAEATTLADALNYHSADAFVAKETLTNRQILMRDLEGARRDTRARLHTAEVLRGKAAIQHAKVDDALQALRDARAHEQLLDAKVQRVTANLVLEQRRWFTRTAGDLRAAVRDHCLRQIEAERRTLATLEAVRPDIRAIDASGGLSRLGRSAPPPGAGGSGGGSGGGSSSSSSSIRRSSLAASQGPRGDAWSGVPRAAGVARGEFGVPQPRREAPLAEDGDGEHDRLDARNAASRLAGSTF